jgi:hypothetical protein
MGRSPSTGGLVALKAFALWLLILVLAIANGALREAILLKHLERGTAVTLSGLLLIACILAVALMAIPWLGSLTVANYALVGAFWLLLTLAFEFGFGLMRGQTLPALLDAYRFKDGNIWPIVLAVVGAAPVLAAYARGLLR